MCWHLGNGFLNEDMTVNQQRPLQGNVDLSGNRQIRAWTVGHVTWQPRKGTTERQQQNMEASPVSFTPERYWTEEKERALIAFFSSKSNVLNRQLSIPQKLRFSSMCCRKVQHLRATVARRDRWLLWATLITTAMATSNWGQVSFYSPQNTVSV